MNEDGRPRSSGVFMLFVAAAPSTTRGSLFPSLMTLLEAPRRVQLASFALLQAPGGVQFASRALFRAPCRVLIASCALFRAPSRVQFASSTLFKAPSRVHFAPSAPFHAPHSSLRPRTAGPPSIWSTAGSRWMIPRFNGSVAIKECGRDAHHRWTCGRDAHTPCIPQGRRAGQLSWVEPLA